MNIAILGYGTVGSGVHDIITSQNTRYLDSLHVKHILIRKGKEKTSPLMCDDMEEILKDKDVDIVVEVLGGIEPAHSYIIAALQAGKHVVSANKAVIAKYMKEFQDCATAHGVKFLYEASCGGGIPWIHSLEKAKRIDRIDEIKGIFNGTTNYILDHMVKEDAQFDVILQKAQELGYAEKDPSADIDGFDIQNKLKISASIAFDCDIMQNFPTFGIRNIRKDDIDYFTTLGKTVKLMALAKRKEDRYCAVVEPILYGKGDVEASISENYNLASLHGETIGDLKYYGQGAGKLATANAIVQDLIDILDQVPLYDLHLDTTLRFDTSLVKGVYLLRTTLKDAEVKSILQEYYGKTDMYRDHSYSWTKEISFYQMHRMMQEIVKIDRDAFMARVNEVDV